jgi:hypothetical protein
LGLRGGVFMKKRMEFFFLVICFLLVSNVFAKEVVFQGDSWVKQTKFNVEGQETLFTQKYQNINGKVSQLCQIDGEEVEKEEFEKRFNETENEEKEIVRREEERKKEEEEQKQREILAKKKNEDQNFYQHTKLQLLKKLIGLEIEKIEDCFLKLDKYQLEEYFVFDADSFSSLQSLQETKTEQLADARKLTVCSPEELEMPQLQDTLKKLEILPERIERLFRESVKNAINQCNDTKRLKELLALM